MDHRPVTGDEGEETPGVSAQHAESNRPEFDSWATYLREIASIRRLTPAEELELGARIARGDDRALRRLVEANLRLVVAVAKRYRYNGLGLPDLVQEGNLGLLRAAKKFDFRKGYRFSTYAVWWIRQSVSRAAASQAYAMRLPVHVQEGWGHAEQALLDPQWQERAGAARGDAAEAGTMGSPPISRATLDLAQRARQTLSLDRAIADDATLVEEARAPFEAAAHSLLRQRLREVLTALPASERTIIAWRYGLVDGRERTSAEVGVRVHLSRERVRQLEVRALNRLRQGPNARELASYLTVPAPRAGRGSVRPPP